MSTLSSLAGKKKPPPPPPKKKNIGGPKETWVTALYTFEGQDRGDLSFSEGQKIKVLKKTDNTDGKVPSLMSYGFRMLTGSKIGGKARSMVERVNFQQITANNWAS
jgi:hypothetical protein